MAVCYRIVKSKEFKLSYSELSENCTIAELKNNLEPIVYKYNKRESRQTHTEQITGPFITQKRESFEARKITPSSGII